MNRWAQMLAEAPASLQRLIARRHRVSLPRRCSPAERLQRLRRALCHERTVRVTFFSLDQPARAAIRELAARRGGIAPDELERRLGPVRPWRVMQADPRPQSLSEQLILLGWLLPRPAAPRHPPRFLVPPEVRRWLPRPLDLPAAGPAPVPAVAPAVRAAAALLLMVSEQPLPVRADGGLRCVSVRALLPRLAPLAEDDATALLEFLMPLLYALSLLEARDGLAQPTVAAARFLARPLAEQRMRLQQTWSGVPVPDAWLLPLLVTHYGIDWPVLRRRLMAWAEALPQGAWVARDGLYDRLAAGLGPLADAHTHGWRGVGRVPWQPKRAARVWEAALDAPLTWLGLVVLSTGPLAHRPAGSAPAVPSVARVTTAYETLPVDLPATVPSEQDARLEAPAAPPDAAMRSDLGDRDRWQYGGPGVIAIPHTATAAAVLRLLPFAQWHAADAETIRYRVTRATLAAAIGQGWSDSVLWALLEQQAGPPPAGWDADLRDLTSRVRLLPGPVLLADDPAVLERAARARSVRRYLQPQLAPGIALVHADHVDALVRALQRQAIVCEGRSALAFAPPVRPALPDPRVSRRSRARPLYELSPRECAALLLAGAFYRRYAPPDAAAGPSPALEERLWAVLPPGLRQATAAAIDALQPAAPAAPAPATEANDQPPAPPPETLRGPRAPVADDRTPLMWLQQALHNRQTLEMTYAAGESGAVTTRVVRPLRLEGHGEVWYLHAFCTLRRAERVFRVDRIQALRLVGGRPRRGDPETWDWIAQQPPPPPPIPFPRSSPPPRRSPPPDGRGVWLEE